MKYTAEKIKSFDEKFKIAKDNLKWSCRFHPTDWFHEIGCPHQKWTKKQLQDALNVAKSTIAVYQEMIYGIPIYHTPNEVPK